MQNNLLSIFKAITPDNIKDIPVVEDSMRIFIEILKENSPISSDIRIALSEETTDSIAEELPKIYLYDYYSMIENLKNNKTVVNKFKSWNETLKPSLYPVGLPYIGSKLIINYFTIGEYGPSLSTDVTDEETENMFNLNPLADKLKILEQNLLQNKAENYYVNRLFKESKGLKKGVQFIYDILNEHLVNVDERMNLDFQETGNPFELLIKGSIDKDVYTQSVAYLSHPLGFVYDYIYISELRLEDNYSLIQTYKINSLEVRCLSGNVEVYTDEVQTIIDKENYLKILFKNGFYLLQENDIVKYFNNYDVLIKIYPSSNHCSIFVDYEIIYSSTLSDVLRFKEIKDLEFEIYPEITDDVSFFENLVFKINYLVGVSIIGEDMISNDTDALEIINLKESTSFEFKSSHEDIYNAEITELLSFNDSNKPGDVFDISNITEDFSIETF